MTINRCATCKHWGEHLTRYDEDVSDNRPDPVLDVRHCDAIPEVWEATQWDGLGERREIAPKYIHCLAFAKDGSEYMADVYTKAEFGCVMHEPKAVETPVTAEGQRVGDFKPPTHPKWLHPSAISRAVMDDMDRPCRFGVAGPCMHPVCLEMHYETLRVRGPRWTLQ